MATKKRRSKKDDITHRKRRDTTGSTRYRLLTTLNHRKTTLESHFTCNTQSIINNHARNEIAFAAADFAQQGRPRVGLEEGLRKYPEHEHYERSH